MNPAGYSGTSLAKKLGIRAGLKIRLVNQPDYYLELLGDMPPDVAILTDRTTRKNLIHYFTKFAKDLEKDIASLRLEIETNGCIWISWPKKASKVATDVTEDVVRQVGLANGLADIKVCAVDEIWSALKLVIPAKDRVPGN